MIQENLPVNQEVILGDEEVFHQEEVIPEEEPLLVGILEEEVKEDHQ